jgi:uncharacterized membrane protein (DUF2068 family)
MSKKYFAIAILATSITLVSIIQYGFLHLEISGLVQTKKNMLLPEEWKMYFYMHIFSSSISLLVGFIQFLPRIRQEKINFHKILGFIYLVFVLVGGFSALKISPYVTGGVVSSLGFSTLAMLWMFCTLFAFYFLFRKKFTSHGRWMIRSYGLTFAAVTLRIYLPISIIIWGIEKFPSYYAVISWACWVTNLLIVEIFIIPKTRPKQEQSI